MASEEVRRENAAYKRVGMRHEPYSTIWMRRHKTFFMWSKASGDEYGSIAIMRCVRNFHDECHSSQRRVFPRCICEHQLGQPSNECHDAGLANELQSEVTEEMFMSLDKSIQRILGLANEQQFEISEQMLKSLDVSDKCERELKAEECQEMLARQSNDECVSSGMEWKQ